MKKIIIVNNNMKVGGVQKSLYNLLWTLDGSYDVTLLLFRNTGSYADLLPPNVKIVECDSLFRLLGVSQGECKGIDIIMRAVLVLITRLLGRKTAMRFVLASQKVLPETYDFAISFLHNGNIKNFYGGTQEFVLHRINADKKVAFIHCDYSTCGADHPDNNRMISQFDVIAACSDGCREAFESVLPKLAQKSVTVRNCHRINEIQAFAFDEPVVYGKGVMNVVMVSRLTHEKGIERAIEAIRYASENAVPVALHIVGGGPMESQLREIASVSGIGECVHFYGEQKNPYRYMTNADLLLMTSFHEAAPMVIEEASCLSLPVLTVRTTSSCEMVTQPGVGWVCDNEQQALNDALVRVLSNRGELECMKQMMRIKAMNNDIALRQFKQLIEDSYEDKNQY